MIRKVFLSILISLLMLMPAVPVMAETQNEPISAFWDTSNEQTESVADEVILTEDEIIEEIVDETAEEEIAEVIEEEVDYEAVQDDFFEEAVTEDVISAGADEICEEDEATPNAVGAKYFITYVLNGGNNHADNPTRYTSTMATFALKNASKKGYTFEGWYTDSKFTNRITKISKGSKGNKTLYARWAPIKYIIRFNGNGNTSGKMYDMNNCKYNRSVTLTKNKFRKEGYRFKSWNTKKDGTGQSYKNGASVKNLTGKSKAVVTLYAMWEMSTYYVSTTGSDSNPGTKAKPYRTIQKGINSAKAGYTIMVEPGTYVGAIKFIRSGTSAKNITLKAASSTKPLITLAKGKGGKIIDLNGHSYIRIEGFEIGKASAKEVYGIFMGQGVHDVTISNNKIHHIKTTIPDDSNNGGANGILCLGEGASEASAIHHITIDGNEICNNVTGWSESVSIAGNAAYVKVTNNKVHDNTNIGIDFYGNAGYCKVAKLDQPRYCEASGNTVYKCKSDYADNAGIYVDGARDTLITNNKVYDNLYGIEIGSEEGYGKDDTTPVTGIRVSYNKVYNNPCGGIRIGGYATNVSGTVKDSIIIDNVFENNGAGGDGYNGEIHIEKTDNILIKNNKIKKSKSSQNDFPMVSIGCDVPKKYIKKLQMTGNAYCTLLDVRRIPFEMFNKTYYGLDTEKGFKNSIKSILGVNCGDLAQKITK